MTVLYVSLSYWRSHRIFSDFKRLKEWNSEKSVKFWIKDIFETITEVLTKVAYFFEDSNVCTTLPSSHVFFSLFLSLFPPSLLLVLLHRLFISISHRFRHLQYLTVIFKESEAKVLPQSGIEPETLRSSVLRSPNWAITAVQTLSK